MKRLKINKRGNNSFLKAVNTKTSKKDKSLSILIDNYYKTKTIIEYLDTKRQMLREQIILIMESKGLKAYADDLYYVEVYKMTQRRLDLEELRKQIPPEQLALFEIKTETKALKVLPRNEEKVFKEIEKKIRPIE